MSAITNIFESIRLPPGVEDQERLDNIMLIDRSFAILRPEQVFESTLICEVAIRKYINKEGAYLRSSVGRYKIKYFESRPDEGKEAIQ